MTAIKTIEIPSGLIVTNAIHRIESVEIGYKNKMIYKVRVYKDLSLPSFNEFDCECNYSGGDAIEEAYLNLNADGSYERA